MEKSIKTRLSQAELNVNFNEKQIKVLDLEGRLNNLKSLPITFVSEPGEILNVDFKETGEIHIYPTKAKISYENSENKTKLPPEYKINQGDFNIELPFFWDVFNSYFFYTNPLKV
jgi:hypothetical protein